jgi:hypothetical protein
MRITEPCGGSIEMADILEELKLRLLDAQKVFATVQRDLQTHQQKFAVAQQELNAWQQAVAFETRNQQLKAQAVEAETLQSAKPLQLPSSSGSQIHPVSQSPPAASEQQASATNATDVNKTKLIKQAIARHTGIRPSALWGELQQQITREYLYAVLSRLKNNKKSGVLEKKGKYYIQPGAKMEETKDQNQILQ